MKYSSSLFLLFSLTLIGNKNSRGVEGEEREEEKEIGTREEEGILQIYIVISFWKRGLFYPVIWERSI